MNKLCANKLDNLDAIIQIPRKKIPKLNLEEVENMNESITNKEINQ